MSDTRLNYCELDLMIDCIIVALHDIDCKSVGDIEYYFKLKNLEKKLLDRRDCIGGGNI